MSRRRRRLPWCGSCDETTRLVQLRDGTAQRCQTCHAGAVALQVNDKARARERRRQRALGITDALCPGCGEPIHKTHRCRASGLLRQLVGIR